MLLKIESPKIVAVGDDEEEEEEEEDEEEDEEEEEEEEEDEEEEMWWLSGYKSSTSILWRSWEQSEGRIPSNHLSMAR